MKRRRTKNPNDGPAALKNLLRLGPSKARRRTKATAKPKITGRRGRLIAQDEATREAPLTTPDGMTWLDPDGHPPVLDSKGKLAKPFVLRLVHGDGSPRGQERWMEGLVLPLTPKAHAEWAARVEGERNKKQGTIGEHRKVAGLSAIGTVKKKGQRSDEGLTPEQLAKRNKRRARREARKRRKNA